MDDTYAELLSADELVLRSALLRLREHITGLDPDDVPAVDAVLELLTALGGRGE